VNTFTYRTASDHTLHVRHFKQVGTVPIMDIDAVAICSGIPATLLTSRVAAGTDPVVTAEELERGRARTDIVRLKLGREPSLYDVLREFGDESASAGLLHAREG
jgi:hypothetical protein